MLISIMKGQNWTSSFIFLLFLCLSYMLLFRWLVGRLFSILSDNVKGEDLSEWRLKPAQCKVFVYDIPDKLLHRDYEMSFEKCPFSFYNIEIELPKLVKVGKWALNATQIKEGFEADYFMVPHYSTCYYHLCLRDKGGSTRKCQLKVRKYMQGILDYIENEYPYWSRKVGRDHLFVMSWDWGSHLFGDLKDNLLRNRLASSIHLTLLGSKEKTDLEVFDPKKDISIPPLRDYRIAQDLLKAEGGLKKRRPIFAYFRGTITDEHEYSRGIRQRILQYGSEDPQRYFIRLGHGDFYWHELVNARFALCPRGWSHWSPRLYDAIIAGAIPVIIADEWNPAWEGHFGIHYDEFTVRVAEKDIDNLTSILESISQEEEVRMRKRLYQIANRFVYNYPDALPKDALDSLMEILGGRREGLKIQPIPEIFDLGDNSDAEYSPPEDDSNDSEEEL